MPQNLLLSKDLDSDEKGFLIFDKEGKQISSDSTKSIEIEQKPTIQNTGSLESDAILEMQKKMEILESKLYPHIDNIQKQVGRLNSLVLVLSSLLVIFVGSYFINRSFSSSFENVAGAEETSMILPPADSSKFDEVTINKFAGNLAINETGSKINVTQNKINTVNHTNCQTPIIPPETNGCSFVLVPSLLGLPKKGIMYTSLQIYGKIEGASQVFIHQKNYQKGIIEKQIAVLENKIIGEKISLPSDLNNRDGIYFRLWDKGGEISISHIKLNFANIEYLNAVNGKLSGDKSLYTKKAQVYNDLNDNSVFDPDIDKPWTGKNNFPGTKPVTFDSEGNFTILRDETSFKSERLESWKNDDFRYSLPPGKWLLVFEDTGKAVSFDIQSKSSEVQIDLKI